MISISVQPPVQKHALLIQASKGVATVLTMAAYFPLAVLGGESLRAFLGLADEGEAVIKGVAAVSSVCYGMFFFKTLQHLDIHPRHPEEVLAVLCTPLAASSYYTAGKLGVELFSGATPELANSIGLFLFVGRWLSCLEGASKLRGRLREIKENWNQASDEGDIAKKLRLCLTVCIGVGFAVISSDTIFDACYALLHQCAAPEGAAKILSWVGAGFGSLGIAPLSLWIVSHGVRQLTGGGYIQEDGTVIDPSDRYTLAALPVASTAMLGVMGAASKASGQVFGQVPGASLIRTVTSGLYAFAACMPGLSMLGRALGSWSCVAAPFRCCGRRSRAKVDPSP